MITQAHAIYGNTKDNMKAKDWDLVTDKENLTWVNPKTGKTMYGHLTNDAFNHKISRDGMSDLVFKGWPLFKGKGYCSNPAYVKFLTLYQTDGGTLVCECVTTSAYAQRGSPSRRSAIATTDLDEVKVFFGGNHVAKALYKITTFLSALEEVVE